MLPISESAHQRFLLFRRAFKQVRPRAGSLPTQQKQTSLNCHRPHEEPNVGAFFGLVPDLPGL
jgi:hypothetical protein